MSAAGTPCSLNRDASPCCTRRTAAGHICALIVSAVFLYAAYGKITNVQQFTVEIKNYKMAFLDLRYINIPAIILPWWEATAALALLIPATRRAGAVIIGTLLVVFIIAVFDAAILRNLEISCGCFGKDSGRAGWLTIARNFGLLAATLASVYLPSSDRNRATVRSARINAPDDAAPEPA